MAADGTGTGWDETSPASSHNISDGPAEIVDVRKGVRIRMEYEHEDFAGSSAGGEHLEGSAKVYYEDSEPSFRPDGVTALIAADAGRIWCDSTGVTNILKVWDGSAFEFVQVDTASIIADAIDGTLIADNAIDSEHYVDGSIDNEHLANGAVDTEELAADCIDGTKIADDAVDSEHIASGAIDADHLAADLQSNFMYIGEYTGNGSTNKDVPEANFAADMVMISMEGSFETWTAFRGEASGGPPAVGDLHALWKSGSINSDHTDGISWDDEGFNIIKDKGYNDSGVTYHYIAYKG